MFITLILFSVTRTWDWEGSRAPGESPGISGTGEWNYIAAHHDLGVARNSANDSELRSPRPQTTAEMSVSLPNNGCSNFINSITMIIHPFFLPTLESRPNISEAH